MSFRSRSALERWPNAKALTRTPGRRRRIRASASVGAYLIGELLAGEVLVLRLDLEIRPYQMMRDKISPDQLQIYEGLSKFPRADDPEEFDPSLQHLCIFDDLCLEKDQSKIEDLYIRGRKLCKGISCIYLTQSYYKTPKVVRINCGYIILKKLQSKRDLNMILSEYDLGVDKKELFKVYQDVCRDVKDFLFVDMECDPVNRFRNKFSTIIHLDPEEKSEEKEKKAK